MFKKVFEIMIVAIALLSPGTVTAGTETQNGGGIAEQNFYYAYLYLPYIYDLCLSSESACRLTADEIVVLGKIRNDLGRERLTKNQLSFEIGKDNPNFLLDGRPQRIASTGNKVGDVIHVNLDLLYVNGPTDISTAIGILTHELGHHQGEMDHGFLDLLGAKVRASFLTETEKAKVDAYSMPIDVGPVEISYIQRPIQNWKQSCWPACVQTQLWLDDGSSVRDLNALILPQLSCGTGPEVEVRAFRITALHWVPFKFDRNAKGDFYLEVSGPLFLFCARKTGNSAPIEFNIMYPNFSMRFPIDRIDGNKVPSQWALRDRAVEMDLNGNGQ